MIDWEKSFVKFSGKIITPENSNYHELCKAFNGNFHKRPAAIFFPLTNIDVTEILAYASQNDISVSIFNGGHSTVASGLNNGNFVINMSEMAGVQISDDHKTVTVGAGALAHEIDDVTSPHGKAIPLGDCPVVGIAGLTLGGGIGFLSRSAGLTCDHLLEATVVTTSGEVLICNKKDNPDLFKLLKGAGQGNFGVVTQLIFTLVDIPRIVYGGNLCWPIEHAADVLKKYNILLQKAPNELNLYARVNEEMGPMIKVYGMYNGDPNVGKNYFDELRSWGTTIFDNASEYAYHDIQKINESTIVDSPCFIWKNGLIDGQITDELIAKLLNLYSDRPTPYCRLNIDTLSGAVQTPREPSSFVHRNSDFVLSVMGVWFDEKDKTNCLEWAKSTMDQIQPFLNGNIYVNYADPESAVDPSKYYGRLGSDVIELKKKLDPTDTLIGTLNPEKTEFSV